MSNKVSSSQRIREIMNEQNLRQTDVVEKAQPYCQAYGIKFSKSTLSQYLSGKFEPSQDKLFVLGKVFGVNEAWLMGFDVEKYQYNPSLISAEPSSINWNEYDMPYDFDLRYNPIDDVYEDIETDDKRLNDLVEFHEKINILVFNSKLSFTEIGDAIGVDPLSVIHFCAGVSGVLSVDSIKKLANLLHCDYKDLFPPFQIAIDYSHLELSLIMAWRAADNKTRRKVAIDLEDYGFSL